MDPRETKDEADGKSNISKLKSKVENDLIEYFGQVGYRKAIHDETDYYYDEDDYYQEDEENRILQKSNTKKIMADTWTDLTDHAESAFDSLKSWIFSIFK